MTEVDEDDQLLAEAQAFAASLTTTVQAVVGPAADPFTALVMSEAGAERSNLVVRQHPVEGIVLEIAAIPTLKLKVSIHCTWDHLRTYLAVEESKFEVFAIAAGNEPLFRVEYLRVTQSGVPSAHVHVHAHRDAITHVMTRCGDRSTRAKRRRRAVEAGIAIPRLSELHFPLGGPRFRPCLEDLMQMLIDELGVDASAGAAEALAAGRATWRRMQLGASIRDSPETAARVLEQLGYAVEPPAGGHPSDRMDKLEAL